MSVSFNIKSTVFIDGWKQNKNKKNSQRETEIIPLSFIPEPLNISNVQDGIGMSGPQTQRLIDGVVYLHVASSAGSTHQKPEGRKIHRTVSGTHSVGTH